MPLHVHDFFRRHSDGDAPSMLMDGEVIVAHVHRPEYLPLFLHAPEMRALLEKLGSMPCSPAAQHDAATCYVCQARRLLAHLRCDQRADRAAIEKVDFPATKNCSMQRGIT